MVVITTAVRLTTSLYDFEMEFHAGVVQALFHSQVAANTRIDGCRWWIGPGYVRTTYTLPYSSRRPETTRGAGLVRFKNILITVLARVEMCEDSRPTLALLSFYRKRIRFQFEPPPSNLISGHIFHGKTNLLTAGLPTDRVTDRAREKTGKLLPDSNKNVDRLRAK